MQRTVQPQSQPPSTEIRPGVFRPDWSAATTAAARDALLARSASRERLLDRWAIPLDAMADCLWRCALQLFGDLARAPSVDELAVAIGWPLPRVKAALQELQHRDLLGLDAAGTAIDYAYPFTSRHTGHTVQLGAHALNALCAIDALGVAAMYQHDIVITSRCTLCGTGIKFMTADRGHRLRSVSPENAVVWYDFRYAGCAATSVCQMTVFFCSDAHLQAWRNGMASEEDGRRLLPAEALEAGRALFAPLLAEPMRA